MIKVLFYFNVSRQGTFLDAISWMRLSHQIFHMHGRALLLHYLFLRVNFVDEWGMVSPSKYT